MLFSVYITNECFLQKYPPHPSQSCAVGVNEHPSKSHLVVALAFAGRIRKELPVERDGLDVRLSTDIFHKKVLLAQTVQANFSGAVECGYGSVRSLFLYVTPANALSYNQQVGHVI